MFIFSLKNISTTAQNARVLTEKAIYSTDANPVTLIKWYTDELLYAEGVNIYRKETGQLSWQKLNAQPINKKTSLPTDAIANDSDLEVLSEIIDTATKEELQEDLILLNVLIKSFQSNLFADYMGIFFEDTNVASNVTYEYKIVKIRNGQEVLIGISTPSTAGFYTKDEPIDSLKVYQDKKAVNFNWQSDDERFYAVNIYRKASNEDNAIKLNNNPLMLSEVTDSLGNKVYPDPMFTEKVNLKEGISYTYQFAGLGFFGEETLLTEPVEVTFEDTTPPPKPQDFTVKADSQKVHLNWRNVEAADLKGMNIYRSVKSEGPFEIINSSILSIDEPTYLDTLHIPGPYYYFIAATDYAENEAHSNIMFVEVQDVIPPAQPKEVTIKLDTGRISLSWNMGTEADLDGYYIYRTVDKNTKGNYVLLNAIPIKENRFEEELPKNVKNEIFYHVMAVDTSYNRSERSQFVSGRMPDILAPEKPFIKGVTYQEDQIIIEWIPNVDSDLAGYHIYRADTSESYSRMNVNLLSGSTFKYTDRSNDPNIDYFYYLQALDSVENVSPASKAMYARRVVKNTQTEIGIALKIKPNKRKKTNRLTWSSDTQTDIRGFVVYRGTNENKLKPITGLIKSTTFVDASIVKEVAGEYYYQIRAYSNEHILYSQKVVWKQKNKK